MIKKQAALVNEFNRLFPVGSQVLIRKDNGEHVATTVRAPAELLGGHSAVAWFTAISGAYSIDGRVMLAPEPAPAERRMEGAVE